jgi:hypothetical protein
MRIKEELLSFINNTYFIFEAVRSEQNWGNGEQIDRNGGEGPARSTARGIPPALLDSCGKVTLHEQPLCAQ